MGRLADDVIYVPHVEEYLSPLVNIIPLQLLAYHIAILRGWATWYPYPLYGGW